MKVLIIEDQENLSKLLKKGLERAGFGADYLTNGNSGLTRIQLHYPDYNAVILDLMLPEKNGYEICQEVRKAKISIPILVLTAKDSLQDKVSLLDNGADDYLVKPFEFDEVLARIRALTRRPEKVLPSELWVYDLVLNPVSKKVFRANREIRLTLTEFRLLEHLMRKPGQVAERENLITNIWDFNFDSFSNIVDVYINRLRAKIDGENPKKLIETVRGVGYKITG